MSKHEAKSSIVRDSTIRVDITPLSTRNIYNEVNTL
jgi:hypothetical protein